ncbi:uncharacterized protein B0T23DRAFT_369022 [Neurospora hispaniola]|uniref:Secreted protein n=1 Tax=Neurospora hispaniola TaxID=588809 RepID=A0AAJ0MV81_9PEZI|nr:hypothetical protein B0T23DRAFT_369022 [Neurospora hispaniola]
MWLPLVLLITNSLFRAFCFGDLVIRSRYPKYGVVNPIFPSPLHHSPAVRTESKGLCEGTCKSSRISPSQSCIHTARVFLAR